MKNVKYILLAFMICMAGYAHATVRTLNNNNPSPGQYTTWAAVQAASIYTDTIYVSGSPLSYGDITITIPNLTIIGTGHNPQKQNPVISEFGVIFVTVAFVTIHGIRAKEVTMQPSVLTYLPILYIDNSYIGEGVYIFSYSADALCYLSNNIIGADLALDENNHSVRINSDTVRGEFRNNIFSGNILTGLTIKNCNMFNNIFLGYHSFNYTYKLFGYPIRFNNSIFSNNIIYNYDESNILDTTYLGFVISNVICLNNVVAGPNTFTLPNDLFTLTNINPLFVSTQGAFPFSYTYDYHLSALSPGKNAGTDGTDIGPYGGPYGATFNTYGEPPIPQIKQMNMPASVSSGQSFNVQIISTVK